MSWGQLGLGNVSCVLWNSVSNPSAILQDFHSHLVGLVSGGGSLLALVPRGELCQVAVIIALPTSSMLAYATEALQETLHLVVEDLGFTRFRLRDQRLIKNVQHVSANLLKLGLDLLAVLLDFIDMLFGALRFLLLLN